MMNCPYCQSAMVRGYIQCRDGVRWSEKKSLVAALAGLTAGHVSLANEKHSDSCNAAVAYRCGKCGMVIIPPEVED